MIDISTIKINTWYRTYTADDRMRSNRNDRYFFVTKVIDSVVTFDYVGRYTPLPIYKDSQAVDCDLLMDLTWCEISWDDVPKERLSPVDIARYRMRSLK